MLTVVCSSKEPSEEFKEHVIKTSGLHKKIEVIQYENKGKFSLTELYNRGLKEASNDIVVFLHDDIEMKTKQWGKKLLKLYTKNPEYGILGVAGSKNMATTGKWWEDRRGMYGRVGHTHEGKEWISKYSDDQGVRIEDMIIVDGVFFSVNKKKITEDFDESVEGFHFYDVDFCFRNYLKGVKVGVHTNIMILHKSIGQTDDVWEASRVKFAEKFKEELPIKIKETFEHRKLKILIGCLNFNGLTGSEISTLETAKGLAKLGCDVTVVSAIGNKFALTANRAGVKTCQINEPPCYKLGDGQWGVNTPNGESISKPDVLYKIKDEDFDIIHANHTPITERLIDLYPNSKFVNVVRSEVIDLENPVVDAERIKKYIAIRPSIKDYIMESFDIPEEKIEVIYNPFDKERFKPMSLPSGTDKKVTLFVGSLDYLRKQTIEDLSDKISAADGELWLVGRDSEGWGVEMSEQNEHIKYFEPTDKIEEFYYKCDETAGIFLGRSSIEGFLCGKPGWIYTVDKGGSIKDSKFHDVPEDLSVFDIDTIIPKIKEAYVDAYNQ